MHGMNDATRVDIIIKVFYLPTDAQKCCFKRILKFTLQHLLHVSVQSPSSGSVLFELAKVIVINPFQPHDAIWHHAFHLFLICMPFACWLQ